MSPKVNDELGLTLIVDHALDKDPSVGGNLSYKKLRIDLIVGRLCTFWFNCQGTCKGSHNRAGRRDPEQNELLFEGVLD